ncbi:inosine/xanthosine triphosphatase [Oceanotoga sp. DSM 15011]|uniref:inosine/xanthosine triphosphatase n=1 Tax=Oceanotoga sp. DSM 15011 TaxID=2984951 RepID=UPI0021F498B8|nr:inosine/xanthosine triphosphatase [Oceanotoga sp. DSM 15011]UYP01062.1 inosine/xanthosine triphosphatase [Oceanotoga sp. DSM 15011]
MIILVGSKNPVKINACNLAFKEYFEDFELKSYDIDSKVSAQPLEEETFKGAYNRASQLKQNFLDGDFFIGIEAGIKIMFNKPFLFTVVHTINKFGKEGIGISPIYQLPPFIMKDIKKGAELGDIMEEISKIENIKQKGGAIEFFSKGILTRAKIYIPAIISSLIPILNADIYQ